MYLLAASYGSLRSAELLQRAAGWNSANGDALKWARTAKATSGRAARFADLLYGGAASPAANPASVARACPCDSHP
jgi:hypothetical protein